MKLFKTYDPEISRFSNQNMIVIFATIFHIFYCVLVKVMIFNYTNCSGLLSFALLFCSFQMFEQNCLNHEWYLDLKNIIFKIIQNYQFSSCLNAHILTFCLICLLCFAEGETGVQPEALNKKAITIINRVRDKLTGMLELYQYFNPLI